MKFNITVIRPQGFPHSSAFSEVVDSLSWALAELGHEVSVLPNWISNNPDEINIVFGAELLSPSVLLPKNTILYNLEQPTHPHIEKVRALAKGLIVWDYSLTNVQTWRSLGYDCRHVPIGWTPNLERIPEYLEYPKTIDALFFGWLTPRRKALIEEMKAAGLKVHATDCAYGAARDSLISRSKVILNVHHDGRELFEVVRVSYLLANGCCVLSEPSTDDPEYEDLLNGICSVPMEEMVKRVQMLCGSVAERTLYRDKGLAAIRNRNFVTTVCTALIEKPATVLRYEKGCASGDMKDFLPYLKSIAKGTIMEIGVRDGASTSAFLLGLEENGGVLVSLDVADCGHLFAGHPQWKFIKTDSKNPKLKVPDNIDILFIDGDHTREGFLADLERFAPCVKPGGKILCHDIDPEPGQTIEDVPGSDYPSKAVREVYFEFCKDLGLEHEEIPGKYGLGVITVPLIDSDESWEASATLCQK